MTRHAWTGDGVTGKDHDGWPISGPLPKADNLPFGPVEDVVKFHRQLDLWNLYHSAEHCRQYGWPMLCMFWLAKAVMKIEGLK